MPVFYMNENVGPPICTDLLRVEQVTWGTRRAGDMGMLKFQVGNFRDLKLCLVFVALNATHANPK
jgi:hypothetical protein